jgi:hypothetical protein
MVKMLSDAVAIWRLAHAPAALQHFGFHRLGKRFAGGDMVRAA